MRGFLALGVFMHHSTVWHQYIQTGIWDAPKSNLYNQLGRTSVSLFFMITSFLFITKLLNSKEKGFNWGYFFRSRIFRLVPMYYVSLLLLIIFTLFLSHWKLNVSIPEFINSIGNWCLFTIHGKPEINNSGLTSIINAGVIWSLPYEWLFYFSLPLISLFILKIKPTCFYILISIIFLILFWYIHEINIHHLYSFIGGAMAPILLKYTSFNKFADTIYGSIIVLICIFSIGLFFTADDDLCKLIIIIAFTFIASGNTLFGLLKNAVLKLLGEISYSTYLIHGFVLFAVFYFGIGLEKAKQFTPFEYCLVIFSITPIVVFISFLGFKYIEKPFMDRAKK